MERKIIHLDLDAFFCAVEELLDPSLTGKAFAVGGDPKGRGVVSSCSYPARKLGIHSAMPMAQALTIYPKLIIVHHSHGLYGEYSDKVMAILQQYTPLFEQVSVDEAFLDVSDLANPVRNVAEQIQKKVDLELHLPCSIGAATSKLVAKVANDYGKSKVRTGSPPRQITVITPGKEAEFLKPLDIQALYGIGPKTSQKLHSRGIKTIGQLTQLSKKEMEILFGKNGNEIMQRALGIDHSPVSSFHETKSISNEVTFEKDIADIEKLIKTLQSLSEKVGFRLRKTNKKASVVQLKLRYSDFSTITRQKTLEESTNLDTRIFEVSKGLLLQNIDHELEIRLIGVGVSSFSSTIRQLTLWDNPSEEKEKLAYAIDNLKEKYGDRIITRASQLKR